MQVKCLAVKKTGLPCEGRPVLESEWCVSHHPQSKEWRKKGGRNKSNVQRAHNRMPDGLKPLVQGLLNGFDEVHSLAEFVLLEERLAKMEDQIGDRFTQAD